MNCTEIITENIARTDNVSATDAENSTRRVRHLEWLVEVATDFFYGFDWTWSYRDGQVTVAATASGPDAGRRLRAVVPSDWHGFGQFGTVHRASDGEPLEYRSPNWMRRRQRELATGAPCHYSLFGQASPTDLLLSEGAFREFIQVTPADGDTLLNLLYRGVLPELGEEDDAGTDDDVVTGNVDGIRVIPEKYHQWVIMPGMRALALSSVGDSKGNPLELDPAYQAAKKAAIKADMKGREQSRQLPSFYDGEWE